MKLTDFLAHTGEANKRFSVYYKVLNSYRYSVVIDRFLEVAFSYQATVFLDYLANENLMINLHPNGYIISILNNDLNPEKDVEFLYEVINDEHYVLSSKRITHEKHVKLDALKLQIVTFRAVVEGMKIIHGRKAGYNTEFNDQIENATKII
ncbi:MAG: hypothetical protein COA82_03465 [Alkaliphilus sp.]|nr:MAG: hypothetical protein COA82_03465 [Alkaliphilus sp.]